MNKMKIKKITNILGYYDLVLGIGIIFTCIMMMTGKIGEYPVEWLSKVPFTNWFYPGIIGIILYGFGNLCAFYLILRNNKGLILSGFMGIMLLISILLSIKILGEVYLVTIEIMLLSLVQIMLVVLSSIFCAKSDSKI